MGWCKIGVVALATAVGMQFSGWIVGLPRELALAAAQDYCPVGPGGQQQRTVIFENRCDFPVWIGFTGASIPCKTDGTLNCPISTSKCRPNPGDRVNGSCTCTSDADCATGQACNPDAKLCFSTISTPVDENGTQSFKLDEADNSGSKTAMSCIPQRSQVVQLSGNVFGRTGCVVNAAKYSHMSDCELHDGRWLDGMLTGFRRCAAQHSGRIHLPK